MPSVPVTTTRPARARVVLELAMAPETLARARTRADVCALTLEAFVAEAVEAALATAACTHHWGAVDPIRDPAPPPSAATSEEDSADGE